MAATLPKLIRLNKPASADKYGVANSALGYMLAAWEGDTLVRLHLLPAHAEKDAPAFLKDWGWTHKIKRNDDDAKKLVAQIFPKNSWTGNFPAIICGFHGTDFQWAAMSRMLKIPSGKTVTYTKLGAGAARAGGTVCAQNPLPFILPCHRVLASNGGLGGYGFGTALKRQLLDWEANS